MNFLQNKFILILFIASMLLLSNCNEPYRIDSKDRVIIDTTAAKEIERLRVAIEDSTKRSHAKNIQKLTDSIIAYQIKAIEEKLNVSPKTKK